MLCRVPLSGNYRRKDLKTVHVFLSTYNGEKYLREDLDSILAQESVQVELHVRDDGSKDGTADILKEYAQRYPNMDVVFGDNVGYIRSFMWLTEHQEPREGEYYAFSDQDDIWLPKKLISAVEMIENDGFDGPMVYYSDLNVVDENDKFIRKANTWEGTITKYKLSVFIGIRGCTMVFNNSMQKLLFGRKVQKISGHDTYIALIGYWLGKVVYDENAYIDYRQTGENLSITGTSSRDKLMKNLVYVKKRMTVRSNIHEDNAKEVIRQYGEEYSDKLDELKLVADYKKNIRSRVALLTNPRFKSFSMPIRVFNDLFIIIGKL